MSGRFGSEKYAQEELIAELSSCFIGAELGLPSDIPDHASYIGSWLKRLRDDKREIFRAAAAAQRAADYCLAFHPAYRANLAAADAAEPDVDGEDAAGVAEPPAQLLAA